MEFYKISFGFPIILFLVIVQLLLTSVPQYEALATVGAKEKSKHMRNPKKSYKMSLDILKSLSSNLKTYHGANTHVPSLVMLMESSPYYLWQYYSVGLIMSDTCVLIRAYDIADTYNEPPTLNTEYNHAILIPRYGCDAQHHIAEYIFNDPSYSYRTESHDIAMVKTKRKIQFGNAACGGQAVARTWVSCDPDGPPPHYADCYWASYGVKTGEEPYYIAAHEEISPNANKIKILSYSDCEKIRIAKNETIPFVEDEEICGQTPDGMNPKCKYDANGALFCKYWKPTGSQHNSGGGWRNSPPHPPGWTPPKSSEESNKVSPPHPLGWTPSRNTEESNKVSSPPHPPGWTPPRNTEDSNKFSSPPHPPGWTPPKNSEESNKVSSPPHPPGWTPPKNTEESNKVSSPPHGPGWTPPGKSTEGWSKPQSSNYVAVGHATYSYGDLCPDHSASLFVKYGSLTYRDLFNTQGCGFKCSSDLKPGERCRGNPSPSLGPVYCVPEPINGGWGHTTEQHGWEQSSYSSLNGWEETGPPSHGWGDTSSHPPSGWHH